MQKFSPTKLRAIRRERGMSQTTLAFAIGRSFDTIKLYERGKHAPRASSLGALCSALNCTVGDLFEEVPDGEA